MELGFFVKRVSVYIMAQVIMFSW
uniref:Uncharacterized protein n=1 Tax=Anguilla anguilla TaxID=7936 RepID=A0A0E9W5W0_ANGAN